MNVHHGDSVLIITDLLHRQEMLQVESYAVDRGANVLIRVIPEDSQNLSGYFEELATLMLEHRIIIGATHYSLVTTEIVKRAVRNGSHYLSLPMATNDGRSLLEYEFLKMDPDISSYMAKTMLKYINDATHLRVTAKNGETDFSFRKAGRQGSFLNGRPKENRGFTSSSFEVYIPIEEDRTQGSGIVDGSLGYLGKVNEKFRIKIENGKLLEIEQTPDGQKLKKYMEGFNDERMFYASEFGIGLNTYAKCEGRCYIEDESAYGTFHIGFGRNIALGGHYEANGHFDIVFLEPNIYVDNRQIMNKGVLLEEES
ncbi:MAG: hypothetical protein FWG77_00300 [Treponema sp.]|nr:hypothetical protein [Treponema sp.]